jgi:hypothetical protein
MICLYLLVLAETSPPRITTAAHVSIEYGIDKAGNSVFNDQIVSTGPSAIITTKNAIQKIYFMIFP